VWSESIPHLDYACEHGVDRKEIADRIRLPGLEGADADLVDAADDDVFVLALKHAGQ
jgi:hypothetical protein